LLFLHEIHEVVGAREDAFEDAIRRSWTHAALDLRDRWQSKLLRTARWSAWH
jgi:hypothetical protein